MRRPRLTVSIDIGHDNQDGEPVCVAVQGTMPVSINDASREDIMQVLRGALVAAGFEPGMITERFRLE